MTTRKAPQKILTSCTAGISALLLLGSALASTENHAPCSEVTNRGDASLHAILDDADMTSPAIRTVDSTEAIAPTPVADTTVKPADEEHEASGDTEGGVNGSKTIPAITTRLPGVAASDLPRFRRHMLRTDI